MTIENGGDWDPELTRLAKIAGLLVKVVTSLYRDTLLRLYQGQEETVEKHIVQLIE